MRFDELERCHKSFGAELERADAEATQIGAHLSVVAQQLHWVLLSHADTLTRFPPFVFRLIVQDARLVVAEDTIEKLKETQVNCEELGEDDDKLSLHWPIAIPQPFCTGCAHF